MASIRMNVKIFNLVNCIMHKSHPPCTVIFVQNGAMIMTDNYDLLVLGPWHNHSLNGAVLYRKHL